MARRVNHRVPTRKFPPLRYLNLHGNERDYHHPITVSFSQYASKSDITAPNRVKHYRPGRASINRLSRLLDTKKPFVSINPLSGLGVVYSFTGRVK